jgi:hypothetical protein
LFFIALLFAITPTAFAATMEVREPGGAVILISDERGPCVGDAMSAAYVSKKGDRTPGCWVTDGRVVFIVFFDGETAKVPVQVFVKSKDT